MAHVVISARPSGGYWHLGRKWGHTPEHFEVVEQSDDAPSDADNFDQKLEKQSKAHKRVAEGKLTKRELEIMQRDHSHGLAVAAPLKDDAEKAALKERVAELEAVLADVTAPKQKGAK